MPFRPTPELVHGVTVAHPLPAGLLRREGWFSGRAGGALPSGAAADPG